MNDDKNPQLKDHEYDGIREYDNPLPMWWLWTFFLTIIFGFHYWLHYEVSRAGVKQLDELAMDMAKIERRRASAPVPVDSEEDLAKLLASGAGMESGKAAYDGKCAVCHGPQLQGLIGPNLTDEFWIHGRGKLTAMAGVIRSGIPDKGMPPWGGVLKEDEIRSVVIYIAKHRGTNPPNAKPPQGDKIVGE